MIQENDQEHMTACKTCRQQRPIEWEMEGVFRLLKHTKLCGIEFREVEQ